MNVIQRTFYSVNILLTNFGHVIHILYCFFHSVILLPDKPFVAHVPINSLDRKYTQLYTLKDLQPNTNYEIRLSYIGSTPYSYRIEFVNPFSNSNSTNRHLLDTEILRFRTNQIGKPNQFPDMNDVKIAVTATFISRLPQYSSGGLLTEPLRYQILVETLIFDFIPPLAIRIGILILIIMIIVTLVLTFTMIRKGNAIPTSNAKNYKFQ